VSHEGCAGLNALPRYLNAVGGWPEDGAFDRSKVVDALTVMSRMEIPLQRRYIEFLKSKPDVRIIGPAHANADRVTTLSFVHRRLSPPEIVSHVHQQPLGIRYGNAYAYRLCQAIGIEPETGVVRASFVHYNTLEEVERLCAALDEIL
jgi:selenocysteine lyase/cysteine desulfurase